MDFVQGGTQEGMQKDRISLSLEEVLSSVDGKLLCGGKSKTLDFEGVATDSRNVKENYIFFPLVGQQDGHEYIDAALKNGASIVFVTDFFYQFHANKIFELKKLGITVICVSHTMYALQNLASLYVSKFPNLIKIGITGSSGKTTTKEIAVKVLSQKYNVVYNEGNLNSETGLPLSVFKIRKEHQVGVFEMGMNRKGEISELASVLKPRYGIITNIGSAHIGILGSRKNIAIEKREIFKFFDSSCRGFVSSDDDFVDFLCEAKGQIKKYGFESVSEIQDLGLKGTSFVLDDEKIILPLCGKYNLKNSLSVIALAKELGFSAKEIKAGIESVKPIFGRNQIIEGKYTLIQDCYNANPDSMGASIEFFDSVKWDNKKIFVLGSMLELGWESESEHEKIVSLAENSSADFIVFFGKEMAEAAKKLDSENAKIPYLVSESTDENAVSFVAEELEKHLLPGDLVLFKGSRGMALERISKKLMDQEK